MTAWANLFTPMTAAVPNRIQKSGSVTNLNEGFKPSSPGH